MSLAPITIILAQPRGFCAGVDRAIEIVEKALALYGAPIYVRHEIVHNQWVVNDLRAKGVIFVEDIHEVPAGAITIFSAHGVSEKVENDAHLRELPVIDATCPLVTKVHKEAQRYEAQGRTVILIGHEGHPEVEGTSGRLRNGVLLVGSPEEAETLKVPDPRRLAYVTQTTLSVDDTKVIIDVLKRRFPEIQGPDTRDICYATQNRQNAVRELAKHVEVILVIGAQNSSNSNRLRDLGEEMGVRSHLINDASEIHPMWLDGVATLGITAGASAPEHLVQGVIQQLSALRTVSVQALEGMVEHTRFKLPPEVMAQDPAMLSKLKPAA